MTKSINIKFLPYNISIEAEIFSDRNVHLSNVVWNVLPYRSSITHTLVSGGNIYHFTPITDKFNLRADSLVNRQKAPIGTLFLPDPQSLFIKYDNIFETNDFPAIGQVISSDIPKLVEVGRLCWNSVYKTKETVNVEVTKKGIKNDNIKTCQIFPNIEDISNANVKNTANKIIVEAKKIWLQPPEDIKNIFKNKEVYLSIKFFISSTLQHLSNLGVSNAVLQVSEHSEVSLEQLKIFTKEGLNKYNFYFLGDCGLKTLHDLSEDFFSAIDVVENKKEFFIILSLFSIYMSQLLIWALNHFPWWCQDFDGYPSKS